MIVANASDVKRALAGDKNLSGANLTGANLSGANLSGANLSSGMGMTRRERGEVLDAPAWYYRPNPRKKPSRRR